MSRLLIKPDSKPGKIHNISPQKAGWGYVGFDLYLLEEGQSIRQETFDREVILVLVEGHAEIIADGKKFGVLGDRLDVFEKSPPHCVYVSSETKWFVDPTTSCTLAVCSAPCTKKYETTQVGPTGIELKARGKGTNTRYINNIAMEDRDVASSLLVTEVFTPSGHWSSYPPHRHDEDDFPNMTYLEETYYHRLNPTKGYGHQRVFTEDGSLDETMTVENHDVVLVPKGHHPCAVPYGYEMYYLNVMAGPLRKWRFKNHPDHNWIAEKDTS